ncbi:MAG: hypothetical protein M5U34_22750 [Chloroflexi bacterium]|nr:hypothetical protein [Chloroflexota bacterium]
MKAAWGKRPFPQFVLFSISQQPSAHGRLRRRQTAHHARHRPNRSGVYHH